MTGKRPLDKTNDPLPSSTGPARSGRPLFVWPMALLALTLGLLLVANTVSAWGRR